MEGWNHSPELTEEGFQNKAPQLALKPWAVTPHFLRTAPPSWARAFQGLGYKPLEQQAIRSLYQGSGTHGALTLTEASEAALRD